MKLPWIPRADAEAQATALLHDHAILQTKFGAVSQQFEWAKAEARSTEARHEREMVSERARYAELLASYQQLKLAGATLPVPDVSPPEPAKPSEISKIIREQSEGDPRLARHLRDYDRQLKAEGKSEDERIGLLVRWTTVGGEPEGQTS